METQTTNANTESLESNTNVSPQETSGNTTLTNTRNNVMAYAMAIPALFAGLLATVVNVVSMMLAWLTGRDLKIMAEMPSGEIAKSAALGLAMIFVATISGMSGGYAAQYYFGVSFVLGASLWGAFIVFAVDRPVLVSMMEMEAKAIANGTVVSFKQKALMNIMRFVLVFVTGYLVATILQITIFQTEVNNKIAEKSLNRKTAVTERKAAEIEDVRAEILELGDVSANAENEHASYLGGLDRKIQDARAEVAQLEQKLISEVQGEVGSGKRGDGAAAKVIREQIASAKERAVKLEDEYAQAETSSVTASTLATAVQQREAQRAALNADLARLEEEKAHEITLVETTTTQGFLDQYRALQELWKDAWWLMFIVLAGIMLIELLVIILKQILGPGVYERALAQQYQLYDVQVANKNAERIAEDKARHQQVLMNAEADQWKYELSRKETEAGHLTDMTEYEKTIGDKRLEFFQAGHNHAAGRFESGVNLATRKATAVQGILAQIAKLQGQKLTGAKEARETRDLLIAQLLKNLRELEQETA